VIKESQGGRGAFVKAVRKLMEMRTLTDRIPGELAELYRRSPAGRGGEYVSCAPTPAARELFDEEYEPEE
jgi:hypothetical protein